MKPRRYSLIGVALHPGLPALLLLLGGCGSSGDAGGRTPDGTGPTPERTLEIDGEFGGIRALAVDGAGRIYAADAVSQEIHVFSPDGDRLRSLGRKGRGPGEYRGLLDVAVRGDSLFALDVALQRVSVYSLGGGTAPAYAIDVSSRTGRTASNALLVPSTGGVILQYSLPFDDRNLDAPRQIVLRRLDPRGAVLADSLLVVHDREFLVTRDPRYGYSVGALPFGRRPLLRLGTDDRLYYGWTDSLAIGILSLEGNRVGRIGAPFRTSSVTRRDREALLDSYETRFEKELLRKAIADGKIPSTKPAFKDFLVDDRGRVWINVVTDEDVQVSGDQGLRYVASREGGRAPDHSAWWVFDGGGKRVATVGLPHDVALHVIRGADAYGIETDDLGVQRIVRYRIPHP